jgi:hypothetical protein
LDRNRLLVAGDVLAPTKAEVEAEAEVLSRRMQAAGRTAARRNLAFSSGGGGSSASPAAGASDPLVAVGGGILEALRWFCGAYALVVRIALLPHARLILTALAWHQSPRLGR